MTGHEHEIPDDYPPDDYVPPYECWVWLETQGDDGREGAIAAFVFGTGPVVLQSRNLDLSTGFFRAIAMKHQDDTGRRVRLAHLREVDD